MRASLLGNVTEDFSVRAIFEGTRDRGKPAFATILGRARPDKPTVVEALGLPQNDLENRVVYMNHTDQRDNENYKSILIGSGNVNPSLTITSTTGYIRHQLVLTDTDNDGTSGDFSDFPYIAIRVNQLTHLNRQGTYGLLNASLSIGTLDERWSLTAFVRNAFDERYVSHSLSSASDTVPARVGQLGAPSQYGVTLNHRF